MKTQLRVLSVFVGVITLAFSLSAIAQRGPDRDSRGRSETSDLEDYLALAQQAQPEAIQIVQDAIANTQAQQGNSDQLRFYRRVLSKVRSMRMTTDDSDNQCGLGPIAAYVKDGNTVHICPAIVAMTSRGQSHISQNLIHESIHLTGIDDECQTEQATFDLLNAAGWQPIGTGWSATCGIRTRGGGYDSRDDDRGGYGGRGNPRGRDDRNDDRRSDDRGGRSYDPYSDRN